MNKITIHVGLDYHDSVVQVRVLDAEGKVLVNEAAANRGADLDQLVRRDGTISQGGSKRAADRRIWRTSWWRGAGACRRRIRGT